MAEFRISVGIDGIAPARASILGAVFPRLQKAVAAVAIQGQSNWIKAVNEAKLWAGEKTPYAASIRIEDGPNPLSKVIVSDFKYAEEIETGRPAKDLKQMLNTSSKVRRFQDGRRFLIIPFRHNVKDMPASVYSDAKQLAPSKIIGTTTRRSGQIMTAAFGVGMFPAPKAQQRANPFLSNPKTQKPLMVPQHIYQWGDRLAGGALGPNPRGRSDRFAGMVRFDTSSGNSKRSSYMTFRIMAEGSSGWVVPAKPGLYLARGVAQDLQPKAALVFSEAVKRDIAG